MEPDAGKQMEPSAESHNLSLTQLKNGHAIDERAYPDLQDMMDD